jgi:predicted amidohydrolase
MKPNRLRIAVAQMKFRAGIKENVEWIGDVIYACTGGQADAILFPECAITGYHCDFTQISPSEVSEALQTIASAARSARCSVLIGSPTFHRGRRYNSMLVYNACGRLVYCYSKVHLTDLDRRVFVPGDNLAFFRIAGVPCTAILCHERRYPELVRLPVMLGAQIVFHPNAGLDSLKVSKTKRRGRDGIVTRAFENQVYYAFANSVGPQGDGLWSAGDSKIVAPNSEVLALANNRDETVIQAELDLSLAGRKYARDALQQPAFLRPHWRTMLAACRRQLRRRLAPAAE